MNLLIDFLFYLLCCSAVLIYGIGINRNVEITLSRKNMFFSGFKSCLSSVITVTLSYLLIKFLLVPLRLCELYPFIALLIFLSFNVFLEILGQVTTKKTSAEFAMPFLAVLLALNEGTGLVSAIFITLSCMASFFLLIPVLYAILRRMEAVHSSDIFRQKCKLFCCLVIIMIAFYSLNISWFNPGVVK